jgi:hypothetical protein
MRKSKGAERRLFEKIENASQRCSQVLMPVVNVVEAGVNIGMSDDFHGQFFE